MASRKKYASVSDYLRDVPPEPRRRMQAIRTLVRQRVPAASEAISYGIPAFRLGRVFLYYAAFKDHIGIFPPLKASGSLAKRLAPHRNEKGNLRFDHDEPLPIALLGQVIAALAAQSAELDRRTVASRRRRPTAVERRRTAASMHTRARNPLSRRLPGSWLLESRIDVTATGAKHPDPLLGEDPVALLIYDRTGHFSAQFMKRDRSGVQAAAPAAARNNTRAQGGYDAYFGTYSVNDATGEVTQQLLGAISPGNVGITLTRVMQVSGNALVIRLETTAVDGTAVTRTLTWRRLGDAA